MYTLLSIQILLCLFFTIFFYLKYASKKISFIVTLTVIIVWFITFLNAILVPLDIYLSQNKQFSMEENKEKELLKSILYSLYSTMQIMSIVILPMLLEYEMAGEFSFKEKLLTAFKRNIIIYAIGAALFLSFLVFLIVKKQLSGQNLFTFLIAVTNAWGIFLIIFLNGFGLAYIPKEMIKKSETKKVLKYLEFKAAVVKEDIDEYNDLLKECISKLTILKNENNKTEYENYVKIMWEYLLDLQDYNEFDLENTIVSTSNIDKNFSKSCTYDDLVLLNKNIKNYKKEFIRNKK